MRLDNLREKWDENIRKLKLFKEVYGHCNVPLKWKPDKQLSLWVENIKRHSQLLSKELITQLESLNFEFEPFPNWDTMFERLSDFVKKFGHGYVPSTLVEYNDLFNWVKLQQEARSLLNKEQVGKLDGLGFDWDYPSGPDLSWQMKFSELEKFKDKYGHTVVPQYYQDNPSLANWVSKQRSAKTKNTLKESYFKQLQSIGFAWKEDLIKQREEAWEEKYRELKKYKEEHGDLDHLRIRKYNYQLGLWVLTQILMKNRMSEERKRKLTELEFIWEKKNYQTESWDKHFQELKDFKEKNGHFTVSPKDNFTLRNWIARQRRDQKLLTQEQLVKLESIGFIWAREIFASKWDQKYQQLVEFKKRQGHINIPKTKEYKELYGWLNDQKRERTSLAEERKKKLEDLGMIWSVIKLKLSEWDKVFNQFKTFKDKTGRFYLVELLEHEKLNYWVNRQLHNRDKLSKYKKDKLDSTDFPWNKEEEYKNQLWEKKYEDLVEFKNKFGHCKVNKDYPEHRHLWYWVNSQRKNPPNKIRKMKLDALGFSWMHDIAEERWEQRLNEFIDLKRKSQDFFIHSRSQLGSWIYQQKKNFNMLPDEKKEKLVRFGVVSSNG